MQVTKTQDKYLIKLNFTDIMGMKTKYTVSFPLSNTSKFIVRLENNIIFDSNEEKNLACGKFDKVEKVSGENFKPKYEHTSGYDTINIQNISIQIFRKSPNWIVYGDLFKDGVKTSSHYMSSLLLKEDGSKKAISNDNKFLFDFI